jgi:hypothetical protein
METGSEEEYTAIERAMSRLNNPDVEELVIKLYRKVGGHGRQSKEYITRFDYVPDEEDIKKYGPGNYQLRIDCGDDRSFADIRIADDQVLGYSRQNQNSNVPAVVAVSDPMSQLRDAMNVVKEFRSIFGDMFAPASKEPTAEVAELLAGQSRLMSKTIMDINKTHAKHIQEIYDSFEEDDYDDGEGNENVLGGDERMYSGAEISDDEMNDISGFLVQLLGPAGAAIAPFARTHPMVVKYKDSIPVIKRVMDGSGLGIEDVMRVGKMIGVSDEVLNSVVGG